MSHKPHLLRRQLLAALALAPVAAHAAKKPVVDVWKTPTCGCCTDWALHMEENGFAVRLHDVPDTGGIRRRHGIHDRYGSCHTGVIDGYALEGHVPAREVRRLLAERPDAAGLAVPAMPIGSPGMDGPAYGGRRDPYVVYLIGKDGGATPYQHYR